MQLNGQVANERFLGIFLEKKVKMRKGIATLALNCKAILCIELMGGTDMEIHIPNMNKGRLPAVYFYDV